MEPADPNEETASSGSLRIVAVMAVSTLVAAVVLRVFFVQAFFVPSESMEPLLVKGDRILVEKVSTWGDRSPHRGDVVVFEDPGGWLDPGEPGGHLVKRVVGVAGDRVDCSSAAGPLLVNGSAVDESDHVDGAPCARYDTFHVTVPPGSLWVLGDNRGDSCDSRCHLGDPGGGFVPVDLVVGKVFAIVWPPGRATWVSSAGA